MFQPHLLVSNCVHHGIAIVKEGATPWGLCNLVISDITPHVLYLKSPDTHRNALGDRPGTNVNLSLDGTVDCAPTKAKIEKAGGHGAQATVKPREM
jgi:hypothetical protein